MYVQVLDFFRLKQIKFYLFIDILTILIETQIEKRRTRNMLVSKTQIVLIFI